MLQALQHHGVAIFPIMQRAPNTADCCAGRSGLLTDLLVLGILTEKPRDLQPLCDSQKLADRTYIFKKSITLIKIF